MGRKSSKPKKTILNVPDFKDANGQWVVAFMRTEGDFYVQRVTRAGSLWTSLNKRIDKRKQYSDVTCGFSSFQEFAEWCQSQPGYCQKSEAGRFFELDKDILDSDARSYAPDKCVFVPDYLNRSILMSDGSRGAYPIGVSLHKGTGKFQANCRVGMKFRYLGLHPTIESAHRAWQQSRLASLRSIISAYKSNGYAVIQVVAAMIRRAENLAKDIELGRETVKL